MPSDFSLIYDFPSLFDRLMNGDEQVLPAPDEIGPRHFPPVQVLEDEDTVHIRASIPGATPQTLSLAYRPGWLIIRGVVPVPEGLQHRRERPTGPFQREIAVPCPVVSESISAVMRNGILAVTLPKDRRKEKRSIPVLCFRSIPL